MRPHRLATQRRVQPDDKGSEGQLAVAALALPWHTGPSCMPTHSRPERDQPLPFILTVLQGIAHRVKEPPLLGGSLKTSRSVRSGRLTVPSSRRVTSKTATTAWTGIGP